MMEEVNAGYGLLHRLSEEGLRTFFYNIVEKSIDWDLKRNAKKGDIVDILRDPSNAREWGEKLVYELSSYLPEKRKVENQYLVWNIFNNHCSIIIEETFKTSLETVWYTHNLDAMMSVIKLSSRYNTIEWAPKKASVISLFLEALRRTSFCSRSGSATMKVAAALDQDIVYNLVSKNKFRTIKPIIETITGIAFWYRDPKRVEELILDRYEKGQKLLGRPIYTL